MVSMMALMQADYAHQRNNAAPRRRDAIDRVLIARRALPPGRDQSRPYDGGRMKLLISIIAPTADLSATKGVNGKHPGR
jgi:hypothetical protein